MEKTIHEHPVGEWILEILDRIRDSIAMHIMDEDTELIVQAVKVGLNAKPELVAKMIGTTIIEDDYFENLE